MIYKICGTIESYPILKDANELINHLEKTTATCSWSCRLLTKVFMVNSFLFVALVARTYRNYENEMEGLILYIVG